MAVGIRNQDGEFIELLPSHDPDKQDEGLWLELAESRALEELVAEVREAYRYLPIGVTRNRLGEALTDYDAAVAANRAHDSRVWADEQEGT